MVGDGAGTQVVDITSLIDASGTSTANTPTSVAMADNDSVAVMGATTLTAASGMVEITGMTAEGAAIAGGQRNV
jgi:hypothetical protein